MKLDLRTIFVEPSWWERICAEAGQAIDALQRSRSIRPRARSSHRMRSRNRRSVFSGEVAEISAEVVLSSEALAKTRTAVVDFIRTRGPASISDLRQMLGSSRRVVVPLMERLDREKLARRAGDKWTL